MYNPLYASPESTPDCSLRSEGGNLVSVCLSDTPSPPISCSSPSIGIVEPPYLQNGPGFACSVSANYSSILTQCCPNPSNSSISFGNYSSDAANLEVGNCDYAFCKVADASAEDAFMSCFNATHLGAVGAKARCFDRAVQPSFCVGSKEVNGRVTRLGVGGWGVVVFVFGWTLRALL
jgi:hypothetical protein